MEGWQGGTGMVREALLPDCKEGLRGRDVSLYPSFHPVTRYLRDEARLL